MTTAQRIIKYCAIAFALFLIVSILTGILGAVSGLSFLFDGEDVVGEMQTYAVTEPVQNLEIDLSGARLTIQTGDAFSVESDHKYLKLENADGLLRISEDRPAFGLHTEGVRVVLTVPRDVTFERADLAAGAGTMQIDTLLTERLSLDLGAGESDIGRLVAHDKAKINSGAGKLTIGDGTLTDLELDMGLGKVTLTGALTGDCQIDHGAGKLELTLRGDAADYQISLDKGVGKATLAGTEMQDDTVYGNGTQSIEIDGGVGSMEIEFEEEAE